MLAARPGPATVSEMSRIDAWAPERHYLDHVAPIWHALGEDAGTLWTTPDLVAHAAALSIAAMPADGIPSDLRFGRAPVLVAAWGQARHLLKGPRPVALLNHGAGQTYNVAHPSYSGGKGREKIALFIEPGPHAAEATRAVLPRACVVEAGAPKLDEWHAGRKRKPANSRPVVAVSFHWRCRVAPETGSAVDDFREQLAELVADPRWEIIGHGHPTAWPEYRAMWHELGVEPVDSFDEVLARADLYVADNTSTLYEFASTGRPVLCLNATGYRREVHHGLRFWDAVPGLDVWPDQSLVDAVALALQDPPEAQERRQHAVARAYVACDGHAAERAAAALLDLAAGMNRLVAVNGLGRTINVDRRAWQLLADGAHITDGRGHHMLVTRTAYNERWLAAGWRIADSDD